MAKPNEWILEALLAAMENPSVVVDTHGTITTWNRAAERAYGHAARDAVGQPLEKLWPGATATQAAEVWDTVRSGRPVFSRPTQLRHLEGHHLAVSMSIYPVIAGAGAHVATALVADEPLTYVASDVALMIIALDASGTVIFAQGGAGAGEGQIFGRSAYDVLDWIPDGSAHVTLVLDGSPSTVSSSLAGRSLRLDFRPTTDSDGHVAGATVSILDTTEQIEAERSLRTHEAWFDALLRHSFDVVIVIGADAVINAVYFGGGEAFGFTPEEMVGRVGWDFIHPDDHGTVAEAWDRALTVGGPQAPVEFRMLLSDGTWGWAEEVISNALDDQAVGSLVINIRDVTQRRRAEEAQMASEQRYRRAVQSSPDAVAIVDGTGRVNLANPNLGALLGCDADELVGRRYDELGLPEPTDDGAPAAYHSPGGTMRWLEISSAAMRDPVEDDEEHLVWIRDATDRKVLQDRLMEAERMEAIGRFASGVVHDFNNVLQVVRGQADLLRRSVPVRTDASEDLAGLDEAVARAVGLVGQLMAFARGQSLDPVDVDLNERLNALQDFCRRLLPPDVLLELIPACGDTRVHVDPAQLDRVVVNLVTNARDAIEGVGRIVIETYVGDVPGAGSTPEVGFSVTDSGHGMSADVAARCFEPFFTTKAPGLGTGLGLATSYGIVAQSGGSMTVESSEGRGTRFTVLLPPVTGTRSSGPSHLLAPADFAHHDMTILVVDDDDEVRLFAEHVLSDAGFRVLSASSAATAEAVLEEFGHPIEILLTDVHMPGENGYRLARRLQSSGAVQESILMSGFSVDVAVDDSSQIGSRVLTKPFDASELLAQVSRSLR